MEHNCKYCNDSGKIYVECKCIQKNKIAILTTEGVKYMTLEEFDNMRKDFDFEAWLKELNG
jgi:hypothetical protein